ncbi:hypothetical protein [Aquimarina celericrescens]|uniref:Lipoprotein n=1 Tax=Aquimarina celericrescens TaxID=1964542 RepID=A0ABW5B0G8_9FLAO|nr:hypothetical protein [Aquimarina celericrescens]
MALRKVFLNCLLSLTLVSCSTESLEKDNDSLIKSNTKSTSPDYGMPFDDQYLDENLLIKVIYNDISEEGKVDIRRKFSRNHPDLVLVKIVSLRSPVEYWFLKPLAGHDSGSIQYLPEEEEEEPSSTTNELKSILDKIGNHPLIDLYDEVITRN